MCALDDSEHGEEAMRLRAAAAGAEYERLQALTESSEQLARETRSRAEAAGLEKERLERVAGLLRRRREEREREAADRCPTCRRPHNHHPSHF